jgi:hypothetical protein
VEQKVLTLPEHMSSSPFVGFVSMVSFVCNVLYSLFYSIRLCTNPLSKTTNLIIQQKKKPHHRNNNSRFKTKVYSNHITEITTTDLKRKSSSPTCGAESTYPSRAFEFIPYIWSRKYVTSIKLW